MESRDFTPSKNYEDSGPMKISDLHHSVSNSNASKKKKEFKRQKAQHEDTTGDTQQEPNTQSTIEEPILNRLRSRLDPTYNTTNALSHTLIADSDSLPEPSSPAVDKPVKRTKKKRKNKSRDENATNDQPTEADLMPSETQLDTSATQVPVKDVES